MDIGGNIMEIIYRQLSELKKLDNNPRSITKEQLSKLKESIQQNPDYFEARPLILSDRTGELVIIAGNQRYDACIALGLTSVPTVLISNLTEEREREIIIRDNVNNGQWNMDVLANSWDADELKGWGMDFPDDWGISSDDFGDGFSLPIGDKNNSEKMTFTVSGEQANLIKSAIDIVKEEGLVSETFGNENMNGNALYQIVKQWVEQKK